MKLISRLLIGLLLSTVVLISALGDALAQSYPNKPLRIVAPYTPGSTIDIFGRLIAPKLQEALGQPVLVDNRPGAGGMVGMDFVAKSAPDGYTLVIGALGPLAMNPWLFSKTPFDPVRDFSAISLLAIGANVIATNPSFPARNIKELVELAKKQPGKLTFGSTGVGSSPHLTGELLKLITKIDILHVPYKGNAEAITDLLSGQLSIVFTGIPPVLPLVKAGRIRLLATTGPKRLADLPDVPTMSEAGVQGFDVLLWYGLVAPAATPKDVIVRLNREVVKVMNLPDTRNKFLLQGVDPESSTPEEFAKLIRNESERWRKVIRSAGIKVE